MTILTVRTDSPTAEIGLYNDRQQLVYEAWHAHRTLAETIHLKIKQVVGAQDISLQQVEGIVVFQGPGSFTGLRIGITVANALADSLGVPIVGAQGDAWVADGVSSLLAGDNTKLVVPEYGALPNISTPKK